ncbi:hypothetical protein [Streptomyces sp. NPDC002467]|uniref:hypothetical protein n=1 Tax=Streptomyces sp. NPDC002467 TaxID=3364647 RepID=UPI0036CCE2AD
MPDRTHIVVHPVGPSGGRRVVAHVHGEDQPLGTAQSMRDVVEFLRRVGLDDEAEWPPIEWRGGGPEVWAPEPPA